MCGGVCRNPVRTEISHMIFPSESIILGQIPPPNGYLGSLLTVTLSQRGTLRGTAAALGTPPQNLKKC